MFEPQDIILFSGLRGLIQNKNNEVYYIIWMNSTTTPFIWDWSLQKIDSEAKLITNIFREDDEI